MKEKLTEADIESGISCLFMCRACMGRGYFLAKSHERPPDTCDVCEGTGSVVYHHNTTSNPYVLREYLKIMKVDTRLKTLEGQDGN